MVRRIMPFNDATLPNYVMTRVARARLELKNERHANLRWRLFR